jgi:hypothetical protein
VRLASGAACVGLSSQCREQRLDATAVLIEDITSEGDGLKTYYDVQSNGTTAEDPNSDSSTGGGN